MTRLKHSLLTCCLATAVGLAMAAMTAVAGTAEGVDTPADHHITGPIGV